MPPPNTGVVPVIPVGATGPEAATLECAHGAETVAFNVFQNMDCVLRRQLIGAVKDNFVRVLHRPHLGYSRSSTMDLLTHLYVTYAVITNADWIANDKRFPKAYAPTDPIEVVCRKIDDTVAYANAGSMPYSSKKVIDNAYELLFNTGVFAADCQEWNKQALSDKTLPHIKVFFAAAHREWRLLHQLASTNIQPGAQAPPQLHRDG